MMEATLRVEFDFPSPPNFRKIAIDLRSDAWK